MRDRALDPALATSTNFPSGQVHDQCTSCLENPKRSFAEPPKSCAEESALASLQAATEDTSGEKTANTSLGCPVVAKDFVNSAVPAPLTSRSPGEDLEGARVVERGGKDSRSVTHNNGNTSPRFVSRHRSRPCRATHSLETARQDGLHSQQQQQQDKKCHLSHTQDQQKRLQSAKYSARHRDFQMPVGGGMSGPCLAPGHQSNASHSYSSFFSLPGRQRYNSAFGANGGRESARARHALQAGRDAELGGAISGSQEGGVSQPIHDATGKKRIDVKLLVKRLPGYFTESHILSLFAKYGDVLSVSLIASENRKNNSENQTVTALVHMASITQADAAVRALTQPRTANASMSLLEITYADGESQHLGFTAGALIPGVDEAKLFVGSLPRDITEESLVQFFSAYGSVRDPYLMKDSFTRRLKGCGFIKFEMKECALLTIAALHGCVTFPGGSRPLELRVAEPKRFSADHQTAMVASSNEGVTRDSVTYGHAMESNGMSSGPSDACLYANKPPPQQHRDVKGHQQLHTHATGPFYQPTHQNVQQLPGHHHLTSSGGVPCAAASWDGRSGGLVPGGHPGYPAMAPVASAVNAQIHHATTPAASSLVPVQHIHRLPGDRQQSLVLQNLARHHSQTHDNGPHHGGHGASQCRLVTSGQPNIMLYSHSNMIPRYVGPWKEYFTPDGRPYYHNEQLGSSYWDIPLEFLNPFGTMGTPQPAPSCATHQHLQQHFQQPLAHHPSSTLTPAQSHVLSVQPSMVQNPFIPVSEQKQTDEATYDSEPRYNASSEPRQDLPLQQNQNEEESTEVDANENKPNSVSDNDEAKSDVMNRSKPNNNYDAARQANITGPPGANIFIFHIPNDWLKEDLAKQFEPYGRILSAKVALNHTNQRNKGYGFVSFDNVRSALLAVHHVNLVTIGNKRLRVAIKKGEEDFARAFTEQHALPYSPPQLPSASSGPMAVSSKSLRHAHNCPPFQNPPRVGQSGDDLFIPSASTLNSHANTPIANPAASDVLTSPLLPAYPSVCNTHHRQ